MNNYLVLPLKIESLFVKDPLGVASPMLDFTQLPWKDEADKRHNEDKNFLGNDIRRHYFESPGYQLQPGMHLHWIIPKFLGSQYDFSNGSNKFLLAKSKEDPSKKRIRRFPTDGSSLNQKVNKY